MLRTGNAWTASFCLSSLGDLECPCWSASGWPSFTTASVVSDWPRRAMSPFRCPSRSSFASCVFYLKARSWFSFSSCFSDLIWLTSSDRALFVLVVYWLTFIIYYGLTSLLTQPISFFCELTIVFIGLVCLPSSSLREPMPIQIWFIPSWSIGFAWVYSSPLSSSISLSQIQRLLTYRSSLASIAIGWVKICCWSSSLQYDVYRLACYLLLSLFHRQTDSELAWHLYLTGPSLVLRLVEASYPLLHVLCRSLSLPSSISSGLDIGSDLPGLL